MPYIRALESPERTQPLLRDRVLRPLSAAISTILAAAGSNIVAHVVSFPKHFEREVGPSKGGKINNFPNSAPPKGATWAVKAGSAWEIAYLECCQVTAPKKETKGVKAEQETKTSKPETNGEKFPFATTAVYRTINLSNSLFTHTSTFCTLP